MTRPPRHPMQPIYLDAEGAPRFKANKIIVDLWHRRVFDLNDIATRPFPATDLAQFWQLLGYSVDGYGELSFIPPDIVRAADAEADRLFKKAKR